jgi:hypothetical protein
MQDLEFKNSFSLIFGILCLGVVYSHSGWIGGFNVSSLDLGSRNVTRLMDIIIYTIMPCFMVMWGYLSTKYFYSDESSAEFMKRKLIQFYPIFLFSYALNFAYRPNDMLTFPKWKLLLNMVGLYYDSGMGAGGQIFMVVLFVLITVLIFKRLGIGRKGIVIFTLICMVISKILPHNTEQCYIQYFGYYTAFFVGVMLKHFGVFDGKLSVNKYERIIICVFALIGIATPILNSFNIRFVEIEYRPNSYEQILFSCVLLYIVNLILNKTQLPQRDWVFVKFLHVIGNNAYGHFIFQSHVILLFKYIAIYTDINKVLIQLTAIICTSYITVYWVLPLYRKMENHIKSRLIPV